jgi:hypothetical protein
MRDSDIRKTLRAMLDQKHAGDGNTRIVEEMGVWSGSVRIDIAVINGQLCGFELKSDCDTLARLPIQADIYSRVFDRINLVVGCRHAEKATQIVPPWWGILLAKENGEQIEIKTRRKGSINPSPDPYLIAQLLWRDEALSVLERLGLADGWRSKRVKLIHQRLASELSLTTLKKHVRETLRVRKDWLGKLCSHQFNVTVDSDLNPSF